MLRPQDIATFLASVRATVANDLKPDLKSDHNRAKADSVLSVLDRVITEMTIGNPVANERISTWERLRNGLASLGLYAGKPTVNSAAGYLGAVTQLQSDAADMQRLFNSDAGFEKLTSRLASGDAALHSWFANAVNALVDITVATEPMVPKAVAAADGGPAPDETQRLHTALDAYLKSRFPALPDQPIERFRLSPGGYAKQTGLFLLKPKSW